MLTFRHVATHRIGSGGEPDTLTIRPEGNVAEAELRQAADYITRMAATGFPSVLVACGIKVFDLLSAKVVDGELICTCKLVYSAVADTPVETMAAAAGC